MRRIFLLTFMLMAAVFARAQEATPLSLEDLARTIGAVDGAQASNMVQTVKRRFRRTLREVVSETVERPDEIEQELADLRAYFG